MDNEPYVQLKNLSIHTLIAYHVDMQATSWRYTLAYAFGWWIFPILVIASKALGRPISFGVFKERVEESNETTHAA